MKLQYIVITDITNDLGFTLWNYKKEEEIKLKERRIAEIDEIKQKTNKVNHIPKQTNKTNKRLIKLIKLLAELPRKKEIKTKLIWWWGMWAWVSSTLGKTTKDNKERETVNNLMSTNWWL